MRIEAKIAIVSCSVIIVAAACGGRSGTEIFGYGDLIEDAGSGGLGGYGGGIVEGGPLGGSGGTSGTAGVAGSAGVAGTGGTGTGGTLIDADVPDTSPDTAPPPDAMPDGKDIFDALPPIPDGPVGDCVACMQEECGEVINACYNDPTCVSGVQCTIVNCLAGDGTGGSGGSGGDLDMACVLDCFDNDIVSAMRAISMFACITQSCGEICGLGSGGAGGGTSIGSRNGWGLPPTRFGHRIPSRRYAGYYYIQGTRIPRPEEVASSHPWLAELLSGRMPDPPPPCIAAQRKR